MHSRPEIYRELSSPAWVSFIVWFIFVDVLFVAFPRLIAYLPLSFFNSSRCLTKFVRYFRLTFPPYLPIICPRLICILSDIYLVGYAIFSLGSLEIGYMLLLGEPGISSCGWQLWCFSCYCNIFFVSTFCCSVFFLIFYFALSMPVIILKSSASI